VVIGRCYFGSFSEVEVNGVQFFCLFSRMVKYVHAYLPSVFYFPYDLVECLDVWMEDGNDVWFLG